MNRNPPCKGCSERFIACSDRCPKDARGEYGYRAWKAEREAEKNAEKLRNSIYWTAAKSRAKYMRIKSSNKYSE